MRRRTNAALLSESRRGSHGQCRGEHCPPADVVFTFHRYSPEFSRVSLHCVAQTYRVARSLGRMQCLLLALNGHIEAGWRCPLSGVKRTKSKQGALSASDAVDGAHSAVSKCYKLEGIGKDMTT